MKFRAWVVLLTFLVVDGGLVYSLQVGIDEKRKGYTIEERLGELPKGEYLKAVSMGYDGLVADLLWLKIIQEMAGKSMTVPPEKAKWIYHALDTATDLDPQFDYMYHAGGVFLSAIANQFKLSNAILKKGFDNNPQVWQLPFYVAVNDFLYLQNYKQAAYYMGRAAGLPRRPDFVPLLATRLYAEAGDPKYALELVGHIYEHTEDEKVKAALEQRMKELMVEINLNAVEQASKAYRQRHSAYPSNIGELVADGLLPGMPKDPLGGRYFLDPKTGEAKNTALKRRLRVFKKGE